MLTLLKNSLHSLSGGTAYNLVWALGLHISLLFLFCFVLYSLHFEAIIPNLPSKWGWSSGFYSTLFSSCMRFFSMVPIAYSEDSSWTLKILIELSLHIFFLLFWRSINIALSKIEYCLPALSLGLLLLPVVVNELRLWLIFPLMWQLWSFTWAEFSFVAFSNSPSVCVGARIQERWGKFYM